MKIFKISPSNIHKIVSGNTGLTDLQNARVIELEARKKDSTQKPLTPNMVKELEGLIYKRNNPQLPAGAITYLTEWYISKKFNRKKEWFNKFVEKGLAVEDEGIEMLSVHLNEGVELKKNGKYFETEYIHGFPDVLHEDWVFDTKNSWDIFSFPFYDKELPDDKYEWQMQGYMHICNKPKAAVVYSLIDTPKPLIDLELKKLYFQSWGKAEDWNPDTYENLRINYQFKDIPLEDRIKVYEVKKSQEKIDLIIERVKMCRDYIAKNFN